jgi:SnoaL-like protein
MEIELKAMLDRTQIIETINQLLIGTDNRDWTLVQSLFAPSVLFDMSSLGAAPAKPTTPAEIVAAWDSGLKPIRAVHHQAGSHLVRLHGAKAAALCYGTATHYLPNKTRANTRPFVGSYDFELPKDAGRWVITKFKFNLKYIDGNLSLETS